LVVIDALQSTFTIITMVLVAYILTARGWFDEDTARLFSRLVVNISLPAFMFSNFYTTFDSKEIMVLGTSILYPLLSMLLMFAVGFMLIKLMAVRPGKRGIFLVMFSLSNSVFIGLPVNVSLFGEASVPYVIMFYIVNTLVFWTIGIFAIRRDDPAGTGKASFGDSVKRVISPPLVTFAVTVALIMLDIRLPRFILDTAGYLGSMTTPLSMLFMGITIHTIDFSGIRIDKEMIAVLAGRFLIAPAIVYTMLVSANIPLLMKKVFIIETAMPVMTQAAIVAKTYGADHKYATIMIAITTIVGMAFIPVYMIIIGNI